MVEVIEAKGVLLRVERVPPVREAGAEGVARHPEDDGQGLDALQVRVARTAVKVPCTRCDGKRGDPYYDAGGPCLLCEGKGGLDTEGLRMGSALWDAISEAMIERAVWE